MAGWALEATSMSSNRPNTRGRMASCSNGPTTVAVTSLIPETVKWLAQNRVQRSRKPAGVVAASRARARKSTAVPSRSMRAAICTGARLGAGAPSALRSLARPSWRGGREGALRGAPVSGVSCGWSAPARRIWPRSQPRGSAATAAISPGRAPRPKRVTAIAALSSFDEAKTAPPCTDGAVRSLARRRATLPSASFEDPASVTGKADGVQHPRRFYKAVTTGPVEGGFAVLLDGRTPRAPGGTPLILPTAGLAALVAEEWDAQD